MVLDFINSDWLQLIFPFIFTMWILEFNAPSVDAEEYLFAKKAFISERRDQAIKLLRQQLDTGYTRNLDNILLRLGQLYTEKYMELSYYETELYNNQLEEYNQNKRGKKAPKLNTKRSNRYLKLAIDLFTSLEKKFPKHPKLDEILFFIGFVNVEFGRVTKGARYLRKVIQKYPRSRKYEEALLYLGDFHFDRQQYRQALKNFRILLRKKNPDYYNYTLYK